jgi:di/tricarboxylate transporter
LTWEAWLTLAVMAGVLVGLIRNVAPSDALFMAGVVTLGAVGVITPQEAFAGFTNPGVLTIAALFIVAGAMRETGALDTIGAMLLGRAKSERGALVRIALPVTALSAFLNNTPVVAMLIPMVATWCKNNRVSPSRLLLPLSYMAILGGTCTLIGTSTHLIVNGLMYKAAEEHTLLAQALDGEAARAHLDLAESLHPMALFELSWVGLPFVVVGLLYLLFVGRRLLPARKDLTEQLSESSREYLVNMQIEPGCRLAGQRVEEAGLRRLPGLFLIEVARGDQFFTPVGPDLLLQAGDVLTFTGVVATIVDLERIAGLVPVTDQSFQTKAAERRDRWLCEAVVSNTSPLIGETIRDADFRALYNAVVIAVHRGGERLSGRVGDMVLQVGDTLLLQTAPHFIRAHRNNRDFFLVSDISGARAVRHERAWVSIALMLLLIGLMATGIVSTIMAAFLVAGLMIAARCISVGVARQTVDWQTLITIGAALGLGRALEASGCAEMLARGVAGLAGHWGPFTVLAGTYIATRIVTELVTTRAAAVLMFPLAVSTAVALGVDARPFVMATTFAAAASFVTPTAYTTNMLVYGPGGYRFTDFIKVGLPLDIVLTVMAIGIIPRVWPF